MCKLITKSTHHTKVFKNWAGTYTVQLALINTFSSSLYCVYSFKIMYSYNAVLAFFLKYLIVYGLHCVVVLFEVVLGKFDLLSTAFLIQIYSWYICCAYSNVFRNSSQKCVEVSETNHEICCFPGYLSWVKYFLKVVYTHSFHLNIHTQRFHIPYTN